MFAGEAGNVAFVTIAWIIPESPETSTDGFRSSKEGSVVFEVTG
jgi:hypothetical protein